MAISHDSIWLISELVLRGDRVSCCVIVKGSEFCVMARYANSLEASKPIASTHYFCSNVVGLLHAQCCVCSTLYKGEGAAWAFCFLLVGVYDQTVSTPSNRQSCNLHTPHSALGLSCF